MPLIRTTYKRRSFLKSSVVAGGGMMLGFSWLASCQHVGQEDTDLIIPDEWFDINSYLKIGNNGVVTIYSPNPEFGQNVKTSMPMIVAEELDIEWEKVIVEQAPYSQEKFSGGAMGQFTGGSRGIMSKWKPLRMAGASAKQMLKKAVAQAWQVAISEITTEAGVLKHEASGRSVGYGEMASAASQIPIPKEVKLKDTKEYKIIGQSKKNVDGLNIVKGKPMFGIDYYKEGMLIAMAVHPPAFGMTLEAINNAEEVKAMPGIKDIFPIKTYNDGYIKGYFDTNSFSEIIAVVGNSTWEVMQAKKAVLAKWKPIESVDTTINRFGTEISVHIPAGLENTDNHKAQMITLLAKPMKTVRRDGDPEGAFEKAAKVIERTYSAPYLAHNCMEPMNAYAHVEGEKVWLASPLQAPGMIEPTISKRMGISVENIEIEMTRMGGGFGRRAYSHYMVEAALISQKVGTPIKLVYSREDDMTNGVYRPTYHATYRAAFDQDNDLLAIHVKAVGIPESPLFPNRFPAGAIDNYLAEEYSIDSNISTGAFRAPRSNFMASSEQSFLDEVAEEMGEDPIELRLKLLKRAKEKPVGETNDYDSERYAGVLEMVKAKSNWGIDDKALHRGVAAYFCHNSYAAHVIDLIIDDGKVVVQKVTSAIDCGIVVNPDAAINMTEGAIVDGIGNALFGEMTFKDGIPQKNNFHQYRMIRMSEAPKEIEVHFVQNEVDPTGLGEPPFPPVFGALANAIYKASGKRQYHQPFFGGDGLF